MLTTLSFMQLFGLAMGLLGSAVGAGLHTRGRQLLAVAVVLFRVPTDARVCEPSSR